MPRRLGQHFLRSGSVEQLLAAIAPARTDTFLEIGPGAGALTRPLASRCKNVVAVELDASLAASLSERVPANVTIVQGDALTVDLRALVPRGARVAGNLPYYASSPLLRRLLELRDHVVDLHVMVQQEVAERVASPPGSKAYGILSIFFALWADVEIAARFPPGAFNPAPKVSSAVLRIAFRPEPRAEVADPAAFEKLVKTAFGRRRRTLENNLQDSYANLKESLKLLNIEGSRRAETLSVVEFARLSSVLTPR